MTYFWLLASVVVSYCHLTNNCKKSQLLRISVSLHVFWLVSRKVMTNIDSILKSRDITLSAKVHVVKAMVFPVVMYGCESWTIKKAEHQKNYAFELWCWRRHLTVPWTSRRSNQSILKEINLHVYPCISITLSWSPSCCICFFLRFRIRNSYFLRQWRRHKTENKNICGLWRLILETGTPACV